MWQLQVSKVESMNEFVGRIKEAVEEARAAMTKAKDDMARYYNRRRTPAPVFAPGDKVYLDSSDIRTTRPSHKLAHRYIGPYEVLRQVGKYAYRLRLPCAMSRLHPVFNVVKLLGAPKDPIPGREPTIPPPPILVGDRGEEEYEVEAIRDSHIFWRKLQFLVQWRGYGYEEHSWVNESDVHAPEAITEFYQLNPGAPRNIRAITFKKIRF